MFRKFTNPFLLFCWMILSACTPALTPVPATATPTLTLEPTRTPTPAPTVTITPTSTPSLPPEILATLQGQDYQVVDGDRDGENDKIVAANGENLYLLNQDKDWQRMITFTTTEGEKIEMPRFEDLDSALEYIAKNAFWRTGDRMKSLNFWTSFDNPKAVEFFPIVKGIPDRTPEVGSTMPSTGNNFILLSVAQVGNDSLLLFEDEKDGFAMVFVAGDVNSDWGVFWNKVDNFPTPQP